ncbi:MAG TPA: DUF1854 domain-containing protein [Planctomycetota bacterium]|nr:DUF1854 domain-containing protein [Planctomycetota bacterium]
MAVTEMTLTQRDSKRQTPVLAPSRLTMSRSETGQVLAVLGAVKTPVRVCRCFPWSQPGQFISLRDEKENEVALIRDLNELDEDSRRVLEGALAEAGFMLEIERIESAEEIYEVRHWKVHTRQGYRTFQTKLDEWPREVPGGGYLLKDIAGDLFHIPSPETMDEKSQGILWALVD